MFDTDYRLASGIAIIRRRRNPKAQCSGIQLNNELRFVLINKYTNDSLPVLSFIISTSVSLLF